MSKLSHLDNIIKSLPVSDFSRLLEKGTDGVWFFDDSTNLMYWSDKLLDLFGFDDSENLDIERVMSLTHPDDIESHMDALQTSRTNKTTYQALVRMESSSGDYIPLLANGIWVTNPGTSKLSLVGYVIDQRPLIAVNSLIAHHRTRFETFFNECPAAVYIRDSRGKYIYANKVAALQAGKEISAIIGAKLDEIYEPAYAGRTKKSDAEMLEKGKPVTLTEEIRFDAGTINLLETKFPIENISQTDKLIGGFSIDISAQKEAERLMESTQRLDSLGRLASGLAHDFNNMLVGILGNAELLAAQSSTENRILVDDIIRSANRAARLCENLLLSAGRRDPNKKDTNMIDLIEGIVELLRVQLRGKANITTSSELDQLNIECDPSQLTQIISNLVLNAAEASESRNTDINISCALTDEKPESNAGIVHNFIDQDWNELCCICISDNGPGLQAEHLYRIFEPFYSSKQLGAGMGLASVFGAVRANRGAIAVNNSPSGCQFKIYLPCQQKRQSHELNSSNANTDLTAKKVLVVDDEQMVGDIVSRVLEIAGCETIQVDSGEKAIQLIGKKSIEPDVIIIDKSMPGLSGPETLDIIKASGCTAPAIIVSGFHDASTTSGATPNVWLLNKPFSRDELLAKVREVITES